jgi:aminoacrylate hydrolase
MCAHDDQITAAPMSLELAELIPNALLRVLPEGGHFCPQTNTEQYNATLLELLQALAAPSSAPAS